MIEYLDELEGILKKYGIDKSDVCFTTSAALAVRGIKSNNDIEFALKPEAYQYVLSNLSKVFYYNSFSGTIKFTEHIECDRDIYGIFNITDGALFEDMYSEKIGDYRVVKLELYSAMKVLMNRQKDEKIIGLIKKSGVWSDQFEREVNGFIALAIKNGLHVAENREDSWNDMLNSEFDYYIFGTGYIGRHVYKRFEAYNATERIKGFCVSQRTDNKEFLGRKIYNVSEIGKSEKVIMATSIQGYRDAYNFLKESGFDTIIWGLMWYEE